MNLANLGKAALLASQNRLDTVGHNINNAATPGYSRQRVLVETASATPTSAGWIGRGVKAVSVLRSYDSFLQTQLSSSLTRGAALKTYGDQIAQLNNLVADRTVGISPGIQQFFNALDAMATAPADVAARQELLGQANSLATQIRDVNAFMDGQRNNVNTQIQTTVSQVNSFLDRINDLNRQITVAKASNPGQPPNDLFDQRDQLVMDLGQLVNIQVYEQNDRVNITVGNGQSVISGDTVFYLQALPSKSDPQRLAVHFTVPDSSGGVIPIEMKDSQITGGTLGGLLTFRAGAIDSVQNNLGRIALGLAMAVNNAHVNGDDLSGNPGGAFFALAGSNLKMAADSGNTGSIAAGAPVDPAIAIVDQHKVTNQPYSLAFVPSPDGVDPGYYTVSRGSGANAVQLGTIAAGATAVFDGIEIDTAAIGMDPLDPAEHADSWDISALPQAKVIGNEKNTGGSPLASITDLAKLTNQDYAVEFDGASYKVTRIPEGTVIANEAGPVITLAEDGLELDFSGLTPPPANRDSWLVQPTRDAAGGLQVALTDPSKIAAAARGAGTANGGNALELAALRSGKVLANGSMSLNEGYSQLVNGVAVKTQQNTTAQKAQETLIAQNFAAQQAVSGVNLDEEYIMMQEYQKHYQAAARMIDTASTLLDALLALRN